MAASGQATLLVTGAAFPGRCACRAVDGLLDGRPGVTVDTLNAVPLQQARLIHVACSLALISLKKKKKKISTSHDNVVNFKIKVNACEFSIDL